MCSSSWPFYGLPATNGSRHQTIGTLHSQRSKMRMRQVTGKHAWRSTGTTTSKYWRSRLQIQKRRRRDLYQTFFWGGMVWTPNGTKWRWRNLLSRSRFWTRPSETRSLVTAVASSLKPKGSGVSARHAPWVRSPWTSRIRFLVKRVQREPQIMSHQIKITGRWPPSKVGGLCSVSTTGMGLMAILSPQGRFKRYHGTWWRVALTRPI